MTDPSQSRNQETRKLVRTQVMKIFARERRLRDTLAGYDSDELAYQSAGFTSTYPSLNEVKWPIAMEPYMLELMSRMLSPSFRACDSLYGLSIFSNRPEAPSYPFCVDIEFDDSCVEECDLQQSSPWFALSVSSPALIHTSVMLAASHTSITKRNFHENAALIAYHKDQAFVHLHQLLGDCEDGFSNEAIAVAAALACYELMCQDYVGFQSHMEGVQKLLEVRGGVADLETDGIVLKIISWADTMGAFLQCTRPYFSDIIKTPAFELKDPFSAGSWPDMAPAQSLINSQLCHAVHANLVDYEIFRAICQTTSVAASLRSVPAAFSFQSLIGLRELLLQRMLSQAPTSTDPFSFSPLSECLRLTVIIHCISGLFAPTLPPAYHQLISHALKSLATVLENTGLSSTWNEGGYIEMLLSIYLVGLRALNVAVVGFVRERGHDITSENSGYGELKEHREYFTEKVSLSSRFLGIRSLQSLAESVERAGLVMGRDMDDLEELFAEVNNRNW
ncbi:MAG: hypothetical protein Q9160_001075 [Pyrenula sp. 1 TL-2023]